MKLNIYTGDANRLKNKITQFIRTDQSQDWGFTTGSGVPVIYYHKPEQWKKVLLIPVRHIKLLEIHTSRWKAEDNDVEYEDRYVIKKFLELLVKNFIDDFRYFEIED